MSYEETIHKYVDEITKKFDEAIRSLFLQITREFDPGSG